MKLRKILLFFVMACFCSGTVNFVMAESKKPRNTTVYLEKKRTKKDLAPVNYPLLLFFRLMGTPFL